MFMLRAIMMLSIGALIGIASGQEYPVKSIRIITAGIGGGNDFAARQLAQALRGPLGQQIVVINQAMAMSLTEVSYSSPDGYTLLLVTTTSLWTSPVFAKAPYDPAKDFAPISLVSRSPNILVVHPALPVRSVKDLIALAKARPGQLNYSIGSIGGSQHLSGELFKSMAGVDIIRIDYKGFAQQLAEVMSGYVQLSFVGTGTVMPHVRSGRLKGLAVTTAEPTEQVPGLPTVAATVPGYESVQLIGIFAPSKTPETIIRRLSQETRRFLGEPAAKAVFLKAGVEAMGSSPEEFAATIRAEMSRLGKLVQDTTN